MKINTKDLDGNKFFSTKSKRENKENIRSNHSTKNIAKNVVILQIKHSLVNNAIERIVKKSHRE